MGDTQAGIPGIEERGSRTLVYFDGLCEPRNPGGVAAYGFVVCSEDSGEALYSEGGVLASGKKATNNLAEYGACGRAMGWVADNMPEARGGGLTVRGDSQLVIRQLCGEWSVSSPAILPLYRRALELRDALRGDNGSTPPSLEWVPREDNELADALSVEAYVAHQEAERRDRAALVRIEEVSYGYYRAYGKTGSYEIHETMSGVLSCSCKDYFMLSHGRIRVRCKHLIALEENWLTGDPL